MDMEAKDAEPDEQLHQVSGSTYYFGLAILILQQPYHSSRSHGGHFRGLCEDPLLPLLHTIMLIRHL